MRKSRVLIIAVVLMLGLFMVSGCDGDNGNGEVNGDDNGAVESAWEFTITAPDGSETVVAIESIREMPAVELETERNDEITVFKGVLLSLVLGEAGITDAGAVTVTAADGYSQTISGEVAFSENTILAYEVDGEDMSNDEKNGPVRLVTTEDSRQVWVGQITTITVEK